MQELEKILEKRRRKVKNGKDLEWNQAIEMCCIIMREYMNDGWIPVEERLPEENGIYLVTCDDAEFPVKQMRYEKDIKPNGLFYDVYGIYDGKVYAWRPRPEPYKPERDQDEIHS